MELVVVAAMIGFNSVFAGYEIALASISTGRLHALAEEHRRGAVAALRMKRSMEASLAVVQLGITLVGVVAAATGGAGAQESIEPALRRWGLSAGVAQFLALALIVAPLTMATIVLGELVPKVFSLRNKEWVCLRLSPVMELFSYSVWPAVWVLERSVAWIMKWGERSWGQRVEGESKETAIRELLAAASTARTSRLIGHHEEGIIVSASQLAVTPLRRIMLPAEYIGMLVADRPLADALLAAHQEMHTRFPVTEAPGDPQRIIGYVNLKDIVAALRLSPQAPSLRNLVRRLRSFDADTSVSVCLERLMRERIHIALVREKHKIIGMVTLEDVVEEIVGEIHDEFDHMPSYLRSAGQGWIAGGFVSLRELHETAGIELKPQGEKPIYTLNDWIAERLDHPPRGGDEFQADRCTIVVRKTRHTLVREAYLRCDDVPEQSADS